MINVIIRIDDIFDKFDFEDLRKWFIKKFPQIPICFYISYTHLTYLWDIKIWKKIKKVILQYSWEIGGHSRSHCRLLLLSKEDLKKDIVNNLNDIEKGLRLVGLKYKVTSFSYPFGEFNEEIKKILKMNGIYYGLTFPKEKINYKIQLRIPKNNLYEIGISSGQDGSVKDWNNRFEQVYRNGDTYILCIHPSQWARGNHIKNLLRILKSTSIKCFHISLKRFISQIRKNNREYMWYELEAHLNYIMKHPDVTFKTFKQLSN